MKNFSMKKMFGKQLKVKYFENTIYEISVITNKIAAELLSIQ